PLAIKGLVTDANVKITDVNGNLVNEFTAEGGQVVWNGETQDGKRVTSGVYLIYSSNEGGTELFMTKLLVIR
ncbi:MAG: Por secretion system protein, partial [Bacteroidetes bacterium SW_10_40_5]